MNEIDSKLLEVQNSTFAVTRCIKNLFQELGVSSELVHFFSMLLEVVIVLLLTYVFQWIARKIVILVLKKIGKSTKLRFANFLLNNRFPTFLALTAPLSWVRSTIPIVFEAYPGIISFLVGATNIFIVVMIYWVLNSVMKSIMQYLMSFDEFKDKPINSYIQVVRIILLFFCAAAIFTILTGISIKGFFTGMGAASAVMMLVFKDSILGFVASIQVTTNDIVRLGDWITMPKFNADGDVMQISLTSVKIRNFDNTIVTVPTYSLISDSFQNWRGMQMSGGRRIKRSIPIKQSSINYVTEDKLNEYKKIQLLENYITERQEAIIKSNTDTQADKSLYLNGRNLTNIGLFRKYAEEYLKNHPAIKKDTMIMVRQLDPSAQGIPMEMYCFTKTINWTEYEGIMSDIFDHLTAAMPYFELGIYEQLSDKKNLEKVLDTK
ncbi:MAG: mechanosensitive ion channel family protein [Paludibacteraceae bacterium]